MAIDEDLHQRIRHYLGELDGVEEKRMFGGSGFMLRGNLLCGVMGDELMVRMAPADFDALGGEGGAHPMVMGGRSSKGWILVPGDTVAQPGELSTWVDRAIAFVRTLPAK